MMKKLLLYIFILFTINAMAQDSAFKRQSIMLNTGLYASFYTTSFLLHPQYLYSISKKHSLSAGILLNPLRALFLKESKDLKAGISLGHDYKFLIAPKKNLSLALATQFWYAQGDFSFDTLKNADYFQPSYVASGIYGIENIYIQKNYKNNWAIGFVFTCGIKAIYGTNFWMNNMLLALSITAAYKFN